MLFRNARSRKNKSVHSISVWETLVLEGLWTKMTSLKLVVLLIETMKLSVSSTTCSLWDVCPTGTDEGAWTSIDCSVELFGEWEWHMTMMKSTFMAWSNSFQERLRLFMSAPLCLHVSIDNLKGRAATGPLQRPVSSARRVFCRPSA